MQEIDVADGPYRSAFTFVNTGARASLMLFGLSGASDEEYAAAWDAAVRFCWSHGWEPRQDDADMYVAALDAEFYLLVEVQGDPEEGPYPESPPRETPPSVTHAMRSIKRILQDW